MTGNPLTRRRAEQVGHALNVIAELPRYVDDKAYPVGLRVAAVDGFFIHLRLLIEFLARKRDPRHPAIFRDDYASGFYLGSVNSALYSRLDDAYEFASRHVAHFSLDRVPAENSAGVERVSAARLRGHADDVFEAMRAFVQHLRRNRSPYTDTFEDLLSEAEARRA